MSVSEFLGVQDFETAKDAFYTEYDVISLALDLTNAAEFINDSIRYTWNYNGDQLIANATANSSATIKNIIGMRLYPIRYLIGNGLNDFYGHYTLLIEELASQAYIARNGRRYHFMVESEYFRKGILISAIAELTPHYFNSGYFWFKNPIQEISSITLSLADPFDLVDFPFGRNDCSFVYTNPLTVSTAPYFHNIQPGGTVVIRYFSTNDPVTDAAFITTISDLNGFTATVIDNFTFTIPLDGGLVTAPIANPSNCFVINKDDISIIQIEFFVLKSD